MSKRGIGTLSQLGLEAQKGIFDSSFLFDVKDLSRTKHDRSKRLRTDDEAAPPPRRRRSDNVDAPTTADLKKTVASKLKDGDAVMLQMPTNVLKLETSTSPKHRQQQASRSETSDNVSPIANEALEKTTSSKHVGCASLETKTPLTRSTYPDRNRQRDPDRQTGPARIRRIASGHF